MAFKRLPFKIGPRGGKTKITSLYFRKRAWTRNSAEAWLEKHNHTSAVYKKETLNNHVYKLNKNSKDPRISYRRIFLDKNKTISATIIILDTLQIEEDPPKLKPKRKSSIKLKSKPKPKRKSSIKPKPKPKRKSSIKPKPKPKRKSSKQKRKSKFN